MTKIEAKDLSDIQDFDDYIRTGLRLVYDPLHSDVSLKLDSNLLFPQLFERTFLENPSDWFKYFDGVKIIQPDNIRRPTGDTTLFTTAGVQHIETEIRETGGLSKELFMIAQPVIRSQFMDKVKDGISTSFVNFSVEYPYATPAEYIGITNRLILLLIDQGIAPSRLKFQIRNSSDKWGVRAFNNSYVAIRLDDIELGESVYIHDYPVTEYERIPIVDVSFGVERVNWAIGKNKPYFPGFDKFYRAVEDSNKITSIIDCIRTAVLIAGTDVKPSHYDPGYRLRQLLKRFVSRTQGIEIDVLEMIQLSFDYWQKWDFKPSTNKEEIIRVIKSEIDRSYNVMLISTLEKKSGSKINVNVNISTKDFLERVGHLPKNIKKMAYEIIETYDK